PQFGHPRRAPARGHFTKSAQVLCCRKSFHESMLRGSVPRAAHPMPRWNFASIAESVRVRRFRWPLFVLLASIGLTALAAVEAQRTVRSQSALSERALREYASFAVWSYAQ